MTIPAALACPYKESPSIEEIRALRRKMGWNKADICLLLGVSTAVPSNWEGGRAKMSVGLWELLNWKARVLAKRVGIKI